MTSLALYGHREHEMSSCILQVYICLSSVDRRRCLLRLHIALNVKEEEEEEEERDIKHGLMALMSIQGSVFLFAGREVNLKSSPR